MERPCRKDNDITPVYFMLTAEHPGATGEDQIPHES